MSNFVGNSYIMMKSPEDKLVKINKFIKLVYDIVNNSSNLEIITWTETGCSFAILDIAAFTAKILPLYYKHKNFSSFVRQLNMYGFHKERDTGEVQIFTHPYFIQGHPEKLPLVYRQTSDLYSENTPQANENKRISNKNDKRKALQRKVDMLEKKQAEILRYCQYLMTQMSQCADREHKLEQLLAMFIQQKENQESNHSHNFSTQEIFASKN